MKKPQKYCFRANYAVALVILLAVQGCQSLTKNQDASGAVDSQQTKINSRAPSPTPLIAVDKQVVSDTVTERNKSEQHNKQIKLQGGGPSASQTADSQAVRRSMVGPPDQSASTSSGDKARQTPQPTNENPPASSSGKVVAADQVSRQNAGQATSTARSAAAKEKNTGSSGSEAAKRAKARAKDKPGAPQAGIIKQAASSPVTSVPTTKEPFTPLPTKAADSKKQPEQAGANNDNGQQAQLALLDPPATTAIQQQTDEASRVPALKLSADKLPYSFGNWTLERNWDNQHPQTCRLRSARMPVNDGYDTSWLWAEILPDELNFHTGSNIDLSYEGSGVQFDNGATQPFSGFISESAVRLAGDYSATLKSSASLTVYLGFWPTWPKTETRKVDLSTRSLLQAITAFEDCQQWSD